MLRIIFIIYCLSFAVLPGKAQQLLTEADAVSKAMSNSKNIQASGLQVKEQQQLLKSAINLPNPEFFWESPSGTFYTGSITQSIEFPSVYSNQYRLQKQQINIAKKEKLLSETELTYGVKTLYQEALYTDSLVKQLFHVDTLYEKIKNAAIRQFKAGQIDYLQQTFAETQYGEMHVQYLQSITRLQALKAKLQWVTGIKEAIVLPPLSVYSAESALVYVPEASTPIGNPAVQLLQLQQEMARQNIALQKSKALPGLAFGYFNQGDRDTKWYNRFRAGITIPLWFGQYKSAISAAKTAQQVVQSKQEGLQQELGAQLISATGDIQSNWQSLQYYQQTGLLKAKEVISTSKRFFESGEIDYINLLRNSNDAFAVFQKYLETVRNYNLSIINYQFLMGQL